MAYWSEKALPLDSHISVYSRPRPLRVAYLIDESEHWPQILDAVIAEAYGRWAGSRTLLVPVLDGEIDQPYLDWLQWWDPDLVYSYPLLKPETAQKISRQIAPGWLVGHKYGPVTDPFDPTPRSHVQSLSSRSVLPFLRTPRGYQREVPTKLLNKYPQWRDDGFIADNFGTDQGTFGGFPMMHAVRQMIEPLNLVPVDAPANRYHFGDVGPEIGTVPELLKLMAQDRTIIAMCDLASWAPTGFLSLTRHNVEHLKGIRGHPWSLTFNLVVGDGFKERISFWNARLVQEAWRAAGYLSALRVPQRNLSNSEFVESLATFLKSRKWSLAPGQDHHRITIRFGSTAAESELKPLADKLRSELLCPVMLEPLANVSDVCPRQEQMEHDLPIRDEWPQYVSATIAQIDMPRPFHIAELPVTSIPNLVDGIWMVDHKIDRHNNLSTYSNIRHWWRILRRIGVARLFLGTNNNPRITNDGYIATPVSVKETQLKLKLPEDDVVFRTILHQQDWFAPDDLRSQLSVPPAFQYSRFSNEGRYLDGTLRLFGGLQSAYQVVECRFWRNIFYELGALSRGDEKTAIEEVLSRIRPRLGEFDAHSLSDWQRLGKAVLVEAGRVRFPSFQISFPDLRKKWEVERDEAMTRFQYSEDRRSESLRVAEQSFESSVRSLCASGILTQGHLWTCRRCAHKNWNSIDDISHTLKCEVCRAEFQIAPDFRWHFHLNEFLANGIREHGHLALVWATGALLRDTRDSFLFSPPLALYRTYPEKAGSKPDAELDILCVRDGKLVLGEVKSSARDLTKGRLASLIDVTRVVRPDVVVLSCMEQRSDRLTTLANWFRNEIADVGCEVQVLVPDARERRLD